MLAQVSGFQIHREKFVQILNINFVTHTGLQFQMWVVRMVLSRCMILFTAGVSQKYWLEQSVEWFFLSAFCNRNSGNGCKSPN